MLNIFIIAALKLLPAKLNIWAHSELVFIGYHFAMLLLFCHTFLFIFVLILVN